jgi:hypothetical protein
MIQPISESRIRRGTAAGTPVGNMGWRVGRTERVSRGFYKSQSLEMLHSGS